MHSKFTLNIFSKYVEDNKASLTGIGVIATVAALFLNLDQNNFGDSLRSLQFLLLILLIIGLIFITISSLFWFINNGDSYFYGLILCTLVLIVWQIWKFIFSNFRNELNQYLSFIFIGTIIIIFSFLFDIKEKIEIEFNRKFIGALSRSLIYGVTSFSLLYSINIIIIFYNDYINNKELSGLVLVSEFTNILTWNLSLLMVILDFYYFYIYKSKKIEIIWLNVLLFCCFIGSFFIVIWSEL